MIDGNESDIDDPDYLDCIDQGVLPKTVKKKVCS